jgi:hypothetical protein
VAIERLPGLDASLPNFNLVKTISGRCDDSTTVTKNFGGNKFFISDFQKFDELLQEHSVAFIWK